jgi:hypothetical protein
LEGDATGRKGPRYKRISKTLVVYKPEWLDEWFDQLPDYESTAEEPTENLMPGRIPNALK